MKKLKIRKKALAHPWLKIVCGLIFAATLFKIVTLTFWEVPILVYILTNTFAIATWTAKEIVTIDFERGVISEGFWVLGLTSKDETEFSGIEKIFINRVTSTATLTHITGSKDYRQVAYKAFLKTFEGDKIEIAVNSDKDKMIRELKEYNKTLNTLIIDTTSHEPVVIEEIR